MVFAQDVEMAHYEGTNPDNAQFDNILVITSTEYPLKVYRICVLIERNKCSEMEALL